MSCCQTCKYRNNESWQHPCVGCHGNAGWNSTEMLISRPIDFREDKRRSAKKTMEIQR